MSILKKLFQVLAAGKKGFQSHGVELNSVLVLYSKFAAWQQRIKNATFSRQDLFKVDYTKYNNIVIFGVEEMVLLYGVMLLLTVLVHLDKLFLDA